MTRHTALNRSDVSLHPCKDFNKLITDRVHQRHWFCKHPHLILERTNPRGFTKRYLSPEAKPYKTEDRCRSIPMLGRGIDLGASKDTRSRYNLLLVSEKLRDCPYLHLSYKSWKVILMSVNHTRVSYLGRNSGERVCSQNLRAFSFLSINTRHTLLSSLEQRDKGQDPNKNAFWKSEGEAYRLTLELFSLYRSRETYQ